MKKIIIEVMSDAFALKIDKDYYYINQEDDPTEALKAAFEKIGWEVEIEEVY